MRPWLAALAVVALFTSVVINPVALGRPVAICAIRGCGVRLRWIWIGAPASISIWAAAKAIAYHRRPPPKRRRKQHVSPHPKKDTA